MIENEEHISRLERIRANLSKGSDIKNLPNPFKETIRALDRQISLFKRDEENKDAV